MIVPSWLLVVAAVLGAPLSADEAVAAALERSAVLAEADAAVTRAEGALRAARGLPEDPVLQASVGVVGSVWGVSVQQPVSLAGAGLAERAAAAHALEAAEHRRERARLELAASTRQAWVDTVAARQQAALAEDALALAQQLATAAAQREAAGEASLLDVRLARLQAEKARAAWTVAALAEVHLTAALAASVGASAEALALPADPLEGAPLPGPLPSAPRADLSAAAEAVAAAEAALTMERARSMPAVQIGRFVEQEDGALRAGPRVSITVPLWRANADGRARARGALSTATAQHDAAAREASAAQDATLRLLVVLESQEQDADIPAEAQAALESVGLGYTRGELDLLTATLLRAEILDGHTAWLTVRQLTASARIERMLATEDPRLLPAAR